MSSIVSLFSLLLSTATTGAALSTPQLVGTTAAAYDVAERLIPNSKSHFTLSIVSGCAGVAANTPCFITSNAADGTVAIAATSASELTFAIGEYLRQDCNMTIGWPRGGNSNLFLPKTWPKATAATRKRIQPWSYMMNVCTHSYSLVWYGWGEWTQFIDWMAVSGINLVLAMTGQEEIQYKVFQKFGLNDTEIRSWFNGPALLTWSRGQNEYGSDIAGPLPRSWMKSQWALQKQILARYRSLGIVGQLPGFQGNVPIGMKTKLKDSNMTDNKKGTAWMDSLDPNFGKIADEWMKVLIADFGTDHWYQLDGYFDGDTAPWYDTTQRRAEVSVGVDGKSGAVAAFEKTTTDKKATASTASPAPPACVYGKEQPGFIRTCASDGCANHATLAAAETACSADEKCHGITNTTQGAKGFQCRADTKVGTPSPLGETSWLMTNGPACHPPTPIIANPTWIRRGKAAYGGLNRTDPEAIWSFQGWAFVGWSKEEQGASLRGFVEATPQDDDGYYNKFVVIDMSVNGEGEWEKWRDSSYWGARFIWTTLHDFGGTDGMKGDLTHINEIPFAGMPDPASSTKGTDLNTTVWGTGFTPEGIDQNPVYYEFVIGQNFREARVVNITTHVVDRSHRRYGLDAPNSDVTQAWSLLVDSAYAQDLSVQDGTAVGKLGGSSQFAKDNATPSAVLCKIYAAWGHLLAAAGATTSVGFQVKATAAELVTFRYDLVNLGRELLAQLTTPAASNFTHTYKVKVLDPVRMKATGAFYAELLRDIDALVGTDSAFLLGPWIAMARGLGGGATDCVADGYPVLSSGDCADFLEWNARVQVTTWNPTPSTATQVPGGPIDYACKHWSGLIGDYYAPRVEKITALALAGQANNATAMHEVLAKHAYAFQTARKKYPTEVTGDFIAVSQKMHTKYAPYYASCASV